MVVAELEAFFSRPVAPTRRIAIGELSLSASSPTDAAAMLLGGIVATFVRRLDDDDTRDLSRLIGDVEAGRRVPQPRMRHRFQKDRIGLKRSASRLTQDRQGLLALDLDHGNGTATQHALSAVYSAGFLAVAQRKEVAGSLRRAMEWNGRVGPELLGFLRGRHATLEFGPAASAADPVLWALGVLGLATLDGRPPRSEVQSAFRAALRAAHPDHGAPLDGAAGRIAELDTARRILLG
jgi:hypothetical protein